MLPWDMSKTSDPGVILWPENCRQVVLLKNQHELTN